MLTVVVWCVLQPNPTKGKMRIHCLENVDKSLTFLNEMRVHLENMGAHDIVDGNPRLTLGLIWTIILRFQVCMLYFAALLFISKIWYGWCCGTSLVTLDLCEVTSGQVNVLTLQICTDEVLPYQLLWMWTAEDHSRHVLINKIWMRLLHDVNDGTLSWL